MKKKLGCILLIDDDTPTNFLNKLVIEETRCTEKIKIIESSETALDYLNTGAGFETELNPCRNPDLIFLDINMPAMDGWEFLNRFSEFKSSSKEKVIMLTTSLSEEDEIKAKTIPEIAGFRSKPLTQKMLEEIIEEYFP
jgi:CheY-like chemotaxis protein